MPGYQDAAAVAGRGLAVFPLPAGSKAAAPGWHRRCTADLELLARTWPDGANIGVGCRASGITGVDLDRHGGPGGLHLYFTVPARLAVPSVAGIWPGVDTRGPGLRLGVLGDSLSRSVMLRLFTASLFHISSRWV